jgi:hypothetical protein
MKKVMRVRRTVSESSSQERILINPFNFVRIIDVYGPLPQFKGLVHIGTLSKVTDLYKFEYVMRAEAMMSKTLIGLPQLSNETDNPLNWSFFSKRVPPLSRKDVNEVIIRDQIDVTKPMTLLAIFGAQVVVDPRILVARL